MGGSWLPPAGAGRQPRRMRSQARSRSARSRRTRSRPGPQSTRSRAPPAAPIRSFPEPLFTRSRPRPSLMRSAPLPVLTRSPPGPAADQVCARAGADPVGAAEAADAIAPAARNDAVGALGAQDHVVAGRAAGEPAVRRGDDRRRPAETAGGDRVADRHRGRDAGCAGSHGPAHGHQRGAPAAPATGSVEAALAWIEDALAALAAPIQPATAASAAVTRGGAAAAAATEDAVATLLPSGPVPVAVGGAASAAAAARGGRARRTPAAGAAGVVDIRAHVPAPCPGLSGCAPGTADLVAGDPATDERGCAGSSAATRDQQAWIRAETGRGRGRAHIRRSPTPATARAAGRPGVTRPAAVEAARARLEAVVAGAAHLDVQRLTAGDRQGPLRECARSARHRARKAGPRGAAGRADGDDVDAADARRDLERLVGGAGEGELTAHVGPGLIAVRRQRRAGLADSEHPDQREERDQEPPRIESTHDRTGRPARDTPRDHEHHIPFPASAVTRPHATATSPVAGAARSVADGCERGEPIRRNLSSTGRRKSSRPAVFTRVIPSQRPVRGSAGETLSLWRSAPRSLAGRSRRLFERRGDFIQRCRRRDLVIGAGA